jgi:anti-sigma regulatory factor (Ser/Thr protein kinase)
VEPAKIHLPAIARDAVSLLAMAEKAKHLRLLSIVPQDLPPAYADPARCRQILINLIGNAVKFTPAGGTITVDARVWGEDSDFLRISVSDTGCGIQPKETGKLFQRLYQAADSNGLNRGGLGIGLYLCKEFVCAHGGKIWVESRFGEGSTFSFTMPIFRLERHLAAIVGPDNVRQTPMAVIRLRVRAKDLVPIQAAGALREIRLTLAAKCPSGAVVLPEMPESKMAEAVVIVVNADAPTAKEMARGIQADPALCAAVKENGLSLESRVVMLDQASGSLQEFAKEVEGALHALSDEVGAGKKLQKIPQGSK